MSFCKNCVSGAIHEGTPQGKWETIAGVPTYVATPTTDYPKDKAILFLTDVLGPQLINNRLLADAFAANGFKVYVPDYLNNDPIVVEAMESGNFDIGSWFKNHGSEQTRPPLDKVIAELKSQGVTSFGATGYCFGGRYTFDLAFEGTIQAAVVAHPSLLKIPDDLEKYVSMAKAPLLINSCDVDSMFPLESAAKADEILGNGKFLPGYTRVHHAGCTHGFAVRGDLSDPQVKAGKEKAFKSTVEWLVKYL